MDDGILLGAYTDEIRELIRNNRTDEALTFCKHILRYYPKHIETYRQMGEVYLKQNDLDDGKDVFRRVLGADPENVSAYVNLAAVFEQQNLFDEAVWHMERAYELAPENPDVRKEMLRLYSESENKARTRLKLTPGALARLYVQEGLYAQAVQEFRSILASFPARFDARVALAETLWRAGRMRDAADMAQEILTQLPYCLKANLIVGTAWKESGLAESATYLERAQTLDPTNQFAFQMFGSRSPLPLAKVHVPRYVPPAPQPAPVQVTMPPAMPDLTEEPVAAPTEPTPVPADLSTEQVTPTETLEQPVTETTEPTPTSQPPAKPDLPTSKLPPWLRPQFAGSESEQAAPAGEAEAPSIALPPWLSNAEPASEETQTQAAQETVEEQASEAALPSWLRQIEEPADNKAAEPAQEQTPGEELTPETGLPDWVAELPSDEQVLPQNEETLVQGPSWLRGLEETPSGETEKTEEAETPAELSETGEWLRSLQTPSEETPTEEPAIPPADLGETAQWLSQLSEIAPTETTAEPPALAAQARTSDMDEEAIPDWLTGPISMPVSEEAEPEALIAESKAEAETEIQPVAEAPAEPVATWSQPEEVAPPIEQAPAQAETPAVESAASELAEPFEAVPLPQVPSLEPFEIITPAEPPQEEAVEAASPPKPPKPAPEEIAPPIVVEMPSSAEPAVAQAPKRKRQPKGYSHLEAAREHRDANQLGAALLEYDYVVQHAPRLVNEVIDDLEVLIRRPNSPIETHRILGDAYTRADRLAEALERYRFVLDHVSNPNG